ncbi:MAG: hypothetical protein PHY02_10530 [Phycisphaerae bacterium]|nr:hypothetical protein [Phycisphaerae bacterium]
MIDFEKELKKALEKNGDFNVSKSETLRKEIVQMHFDKKLRRTKLFFGIYFLLSLGITGAGYIGLRSATDTRGMFLWLILFMIGFNSTILMKLWYWVVNTKLSILKEIKELQLQIADQAGKKLPVES